MENNNKEKILFYGCIFPEYEKDGLNEIELGTFKWFVNKKNKYDSKGGFSSWDEAKDDMIKKYGHYDNFELKNEDKKNIM